jgi:hypothetical protein
MGQDTQDNDTHHIYNQHIDIHQNNIQHNDIQYIYIQDNDIQQKHIKNVTLVGRLCYAKCSNFVI